MKTERTRIEVITPKLASGVAALAMLAGIMVLVGWEFDIAALKSILPVWVAMKANTAVCFILIGVALWLTARHSVSDFGFRISEKSLRAPHSAIRNPHSAILIARLCLLLAGLIGLLSLGEFIFDWNPGLDLLLFYEPSGAVGTSYPGRMAPEAALSFVLLATALWISGGKRNTRSGVLAAVSFGFTVSVLALAAMQSYITPELGSYGWFGLTIMAMHTALLFVLLGIAVTAISWRQDAIPWLLGRNITEAFACGMAVLVIIGFNTSRSYFWTEETSSQIKYEEYVLNNIERVVAEIIDAQAHAVSYVITGDERLKTHYLEAQANGNEELDALRQFVADNPHQQQQIARVETNIKAELQWLQQLVDAKRTGINAPDERKMVVDGDTLLHNMHFTIKQIESEHNENIRQLNQELKSASRLSYVIIFTGTFTGLLIFLAAIFKLNFAAGKRRQADEIIRQSNELLRSVMENVPVRIFWKDSDSRYLGCNTLFAKDAGRSSPDELIGKTDFEMGWKDQADLYRADDKAVMESGNPRLDLEELQTTPDGKNIWLSTSKVPMRDESNRIVGLLGVYQDITKRKQETERLKNSEYRHRKIIQNSMDGFCIVDTEGHILEMNDAYCQISGYAREELLHMRIADVEAQESPDETARHMQEIKLHGHVRFETRHKRKDGQLLDIEASVVYVADKNEGKFLTFVRDITARKRTEEVLRKSEAEFHTLAEAMPQIVWITRADGWNIYFNQHWMDYTGLTLEESKGHGWNKPFHPDDQQRAWDAWQLAVAGRGIYSIESRLRRADGVYRWWLVRGVPLLDAAGNILKWFGTCTDIHDLKMAGMEIARANDELRERKRSFTDMLDNVELVSVMRDREERITYCNEFLLRMTGWKYEEVIGRNWIELFVPPEIAQQKEKAFAELLLNKPEARHYESEMLTRSGERRLIRWNHSVLRSGDGNVIGTASIGENITEQKRLELDREQYLKFFMLSINPMCIADPYGCFTRVNPAFVKLTGYSESELIAKPFLDFVLPEDRQKTEDEMKLQVEKRPTLYFNNRYLCKDGRVIDLSWTAYYDKHDAITYATAIDITERKQTEVKLAEQLEELRRWHDITAGREGRILELKHEVNELLSQTGKHPRYSSAESQEKMEK